MVAWHGLLRLAEELLSLEDSERQVTEKRLEILEEKRLEGNALEDLRIEAHSRGFSMLFNAFIIVSRCQVLALEAENQLLKQQQAEWRRSQSLMLRLAEEVHRRPLQDLEPPAPHENEELRQRVDRLRREKEDLVHRRTGRGSTSDMNISC